MEERYVMNEEINIDEFPADAEKLLRDDPAPAEKPKQAPKKSKKKPVKNKKQKKSRSKASRFFGFLGKLLLFLVETALLLVIALYGVMFVLAKGPSPTARDLFVMSVRETSAVGWLANIYFTDEEIAKIENRVEVEDYIETDTSLIQIPKETLAPEGENIPEDQVPKPDAWGLIDEDGDGIIVEEVKGEGYSGYMMIVLDPSRVIVGSDPAYFGDCGFTVEEMVQRFDAVAGTNAGGFYDPDGKGNGSIPDTMVVFEGKVYYAGNGIRKGFVGIDSNHILHVATRITEAEILEKDIQYGVCFGPVLISNGEPCETGTGASGVNASVFNQSEAAVNVTGNTVTVSGLNAGNYTLTLTTIPDANHNPVTVNATITVNRLKTDLTASEITTTYNINKDLVVT
jgi:exopolysaccharide biosynthesis protein